MKKTHRPPSVRRVYCTRPQAPPPVRLGKMEQGCMNARREGRVGAGGAGGGVEGPGGSKFALLASERAPPPSSAMTRACPEGRTHFFPFAQLQLSGVGAPHFFAVCMTCLLTRALVLA